MTTVYHLVHVIDMQPLYFLIHRLLFLCVCPCLCVYHSVCVCLSVCHSVCLCAVGLLETLCEHIRHLHNTLSIDALDMSKLPASNKKKV